MKTLTLLVAMFAVVTGAPMLATATYPNPPNCAQVATNLIACDLVEGTYEIVAPAGVNVRLTNNTSGFLQIDNVQAITNERAYWSEFCVSLDYFDSPAQTSAGVGEVGCTFKRRLQEYPLGEDYPPLTWYGPVLATGLSVPPGVPSGRVFIGSHTTGALGPPPDYEQHTYIVTASRQTAGVHAYRSPQTDPGSRNCLGFDHLPDMSEWEPWQNTTGRDLYVGGATIFAVTGVAGTTVDSACLYISSTAAAPPMPSSPPGRWSWCAGLDSRGAANVPPQVLLAGEWIGGRAWNTCAAPGQWNWAAYTYVSDTPIAPIRTTCCRDFNGDGKADIIWGDTAGNVVMWLMDGATVTSSPSLGNVSSVWSVAGVGDFNGDTNADILWRDTAGNVAMWLMNGATVLVNSSLGNVPTVWSVVGTGDFNGDGKADILWRDTAGNVVMWLMNGASVMSNSWLGNVSTAWSVVGVGDFSGDGKADILWRDTAGNVVIWLMNGASVVGSGAPGTVSTVWSVAGIGDFNGDGKADILWHDDGAGTVSIWLMNGTVVMGTGSPGGASTDWQIMGVGNFNGDAMADILWRNVSGATAVWFMNGTSLNGSPASSGTAGSNWRIR